MVRRLSFVVCLSALAAVLVGADPASANKPTQIFNRSIGFVCSDVRTADGGVQIGAELFSEFETPDASINYWVPPETPEDSESTYRSSSLITDQNVTLTGYHFEGTLVMEDRDFNPVGTARFVVDLIATSDPEDVGEKSKFGNRNIHDKSTIQFFSVSGSVTLHDGKVFNLTDCVGPDGAPSDMAGHDTIVDVRITDPSQFVISRSGILVLCDLSTEDYSAELRASAEDADVGGDLFFSDANQTIGGQAEEITLTPDVFSATIPLVNFDTEEPAGTAIVEATLARGERTTIRVEENGQRSKKVGWLLDVTGTLTVPTEPATVIDLASCFAFDGTEQVTEHRPRD